MLKVHCDKCKKQFLVNLIERDRAKGIREKVFICPYCKETYHVSYKNKEVKKIEGDIFRHSMGLRKATLTGNETIIKHHTRELRKLKEKNRAEQEKIRKKLKDQ